MFFCDCVEVIKQKRDTPKGCPLNESKCFYLPLQ